MDGKWLSRKAPAGPSEGNVSKKQQVDFSSYRHAPTASSSSDGEDCDWEDEKRAHRIQGTKPVPSPVSPPPMMKIPRKPSAAPSIGKNLQSPFVKKLPMSPLPPVPMGSGGRDAIKKKREELHRKQQLKVRREQEEGQERQKKVKVDEAMHGAVPAASPGPVAAGIPVKRGRLRRARTDDSSDEENDRNNASREGEASSGIADDCSTRGIQGGNRIDGKVPAPYSDEELVLLLDEAPRDDGARGVNGSRAKMGKGDLGNREAGMPLDDGQDRTNRKIGKARKETAGGVDQAEGVGSDSDADQEESDWDDEEALGAEKIIKACELISQRLMEEIRHWGQKHAEDRLDLTNMEDDRGVPRPESEGTSATTTGGGRGVHEGAGQSLHKTARVQADILARACPGVDFKPYQLVGINWLFLLHQLDLDLPRSLLPEEAFRGRWAKEDLRLNGVLADDMGLGKTAQTIAFLAYLCALKPRTLTHLIIVPASVLTNWQNEFEKFAPDLDVFVYHGSAKERADLRAEYEEEMQRLEKEGRGAGSRVADVVLATYTYWEKETAELDRKFLNRISVEYMVLDEGHSIKNVKSQRFQRLRKQKAKRRLLLTGTPLQNDVREVLALLSFLNPRILSLHGTEGATVDGFWQSLVAGGKEGRRDKGDGSSSGLRGEKAAMDRLKRIFAPFVLRRLKTDVLDQLTKKSQEVEMIPLTASQRAVYESVTQRHFQRLEESANRRAVQALTLPVLNLASERHGSREEGRESAVIAKDDGETKPRKKGRKKKEDAEGQVLGSGQTGNAIAEGRKKRMLRSTEASRQKDRDSQDATAQAAAGAASLSERDAGHIFTEWRKVANHTLLLRRRFSDSALVEMAAVLHQTGYFGWECSVAMVRKELEGLCDYELHAIAEDERRLAHLTLPTDTLFDSCKCQRLRVLLPQLLAEGHRVLIFSMWTRVLDILGAMLERVLHVPYLRLDGQTPVAERQEMIDQYNTPNAEVSIFLLSTRAGGLGINLTSADTVILHDPDWNPSMDAQAIDRCHRIGQSKPVTVYRLVAEGTVDERIYQRALGKREKTEALLENGGLDDEEGGDLGGEGVGGGKEISRIVQSEFLAYQEARERAKQARAAEEEETSDSTFDSSEDEADREGEEDENEPVQYVGSRNGPAETNRDITKRSTPQRRYSSVLEDIVSEEGDEDDGQDV